MFPSRSFDGRSDLDDMSVDDQASRQDDESGINTTNASRDGTPPSQSRYPHYQSDADEGEDEVDIEEDDEENEVDDRDAEDVEEEEDAGEDEDEVDSVSSLNPFGSCFPHNGSPGGCWRRVRNLFLSSSTASSQD